MKWELYLKIKKELSFKKARNKRVVQRIENSFCVAE
jgi:hypothetical protein